MEHLRAPLLQFAERLDVAFVRTARSGVMSWLDLAGAIPALPYVSQANFNRHRRLWDRYVPDAHGIQVLPPPTCPDSGPYRTGTCNPWLVAAIWSRPATWNPGSPPPSPTRTS